MDQNTRMHGYRDTGLDSSYSSSFEQDDVNYRAAAPVTTLGALFRDPKPKDSAASPTTPLSFGSTRRHPFYTGRQSISERMLKLSAPTDSYTPPTAPNNPSELGTAASLMSFGEVILNDSAGNSNASSPLAFGSPGRTSPYARSPARSPGPSMSGRIQKPGSGRCPSLRGNKVAKLGQRNQIDSLQSQLYNDMRTLGVDHHKIVHWLEKLKGLYHNRGEQQEEENYTNYKPESPLVDGSQPPHAVEDPAVGSIALLQHKFAQLARVKASSHGQQIPLYPHQNYHEGRSPGQRTPASPSSSTARVGRSGESSPDSSYEFDETTAAMVAHQQEMMWRNARSSPSGTSESNGSQSPSWSAAGDSPRSNTGCRGDEANHALPSYPKLRHNLGRQSNLGAFPHSSLRGAETANTGFGGITPEVSLKSLFAIDTPESVGVAKITNSQKKSASSIETAMSKLSFSLTPKLTSPRCKTLRPWGTGLSLNTQPPHDRPGGKFRGSEVPGTWSNASDVQSLYDRVECREDIRIEHEEVVDTSLRL